MSKRVRNAIGLSLRKQEREVERERRQRARRKLGGSTPNPDLQREPKETPR